jgi:hypothetical protein
MAPPNPIAITMNPPLAPGKPHSRIDIALHPVQSRFMKVASRTASRRIGETAPHSEGSGVHTVKEIGLLELLLRAAGRLAAISGVIALLIWLTWVMLDVKNMQSGFTLPY